MELNLICGKDKIRPVMQYVKVKKDFCMATNAHVLGKIKTETIFDLEFIAKLPEEGILIHQEDWKKLKNAVSIEWKSKDVIKICYSGKKRDVLIESETESNIGIYPNIDAVIPTEENRQVELNQIAFNASLLLDLQKALSIPSVKLQFSGVRRPIYVTDSSGQSESIGVIMPITF